MHQHHQGDTSRTTVVGGVIVERRCIAKLSLAMIAALSLAPIRQLLAKEAVVHPAHISWNELLDKLVALATNLVQSKDPNEEAYLVEVSDLARKLEQLPETSFFPKRIASNWSYREFPLGIVQYRLEPNARIPFHDHRGFNGVLLAIEGETLVRSFDVVESRQRAQVCGSFQIEETSARLLRPGDISTLTRCRDNIHDICAGGNGCRFIDFVTFLDRGGDSVELEVEHEPSRDARGRKRFNAKWKADGLGGACSARIHSNEQASHV